MLEAFDTLFNKRDYVAAERFWSDRYIQHSAHIPPAAKGYSILFAAFPIRKVVAPSRTSRAVTLLIEVAST